LASMLCLLPVRSRTLLLQQRRTAGELHRNDRARTTLPHRLVLRLLLLRVWRLLQAVGCRACLRGLWQHRRSLPRAARTSRHPVQRLSGRSRLYRLPVRTRAAVRTVSHRRSLRLAVVLRRSIELRAIARGWRIVRPRGERLQERSMRRRGDLRHRGLVLPELGFGSL